MIRPLAMRNLLCLEALFSSLVLFAESFPFIPRDLVVGVLEGWWGKALNDWRAAACVPIRYIFLKRPAVVVN
jgi:hypothetical protein